MSFGEQAVQQVFWCLHRFECLTELTVGDSSFWSQLSASYYDLHLDADCDQSSIAASTNKLQEVTFQSCDFDDGSWQSFCQGVARNSTFERLVLKDISIPGWRESSDDPSPSARANKTIERTQQMLDAVKESKTRLDLEIISHDDVDAFDATLWKAFSRRIFTEKKANAIVNDTSIKRMSFVVDNSDDDAWKLVCDGVAASTSLQYLTICYFSREWPQRMVQRTRQFIEAMKVNTSLINVDFSYTVHPYPAKNIWDEHTPAISSETSSSPLRMLR
jgi:hypothetical protein